MAGPTGPVPAALSLRCVGWKLRLMYECCETRRVFHRASFTWWVTIVQLICFVVTMSVYGVATIGGLTTTIRGEVAH